MISINKSTHRTIKTSWLFHIGRQDFGQIKNPISFQALFPFASSMTSRIFCLQGDIRHINVQLCLECKGVLPNFLVKYTISPMTDNGTSISAKPGEQIPNRYGHHSQQGSGLDLNVGIANVNSRDSKTIEVRASKQQFTYSAILTGAYIPSGQEGKLIARHHYAITQEGANHHQWMQAKSCAMLS